MPKKQLWNNIVMCGFAIALVFCLVGICPVFGYASSISITSSDVLESVPDATITDISYSLKDAGYMSPAIKQQGTNCWAYAIISAVESNALKNGVGTPDTLKFSELQLIWTMYNRSGITTKGAVLEALKDIEGDEVYPLVASQIWLLGSDLLSPAFHLMTGIGVVNESDMPDDWKNPAYDANITYTFPETPLSSEYAVNHTAYRITDFYTISSQNIPAVKEHLLQYGAGVVGYNAGTHNPVTVSSSSIQEGIINTSSPYITACYQNRYGYYDHLAVIAGWNDAFPKSVFPASMRPDRDGAWLLKGSWGPGYGDDGYYWISYDDLSLSDVLFFNGTVPDDSRNVYQYDGGIAKGPIQSYVDLAIRNNFTADCNETLTEVAIYSPAVQEYRLSILVNDNETLNQSGRFAYPGYYTIPLTSPISLNESDAFAVLVNLTSQNSIGYVSCDAGTVGSGYTVRTTSDYGQGRIYWYDTVVHKAYTADLKDMDTSILSTSNQNFRIKAITERSIEEEEVIEESRFPNYRDLHQLLETSEEKPRYSFR